MQILLLYYIWIWKYGAHFSIGVQIDSSNKKFSNDSDNKNKKQTNKTQLASKQILPLISKKSVVTIIPNL